VGTSASEESSLPCLQNGRTEQPPPIQQTKDIFYGQPIPAFQVDIKELSSCSTSSRYRFVPLFYLPNWLGQEHFKRFAIDSYDYWHTYTVQHVLKHYTQSPTKGYITIT